MANNLRLRLKRISLNPSNLLENGGVVFEATERAAQVAVKYAKESAPTRTEVLRDSIGYRMRRTPTKVVAEIGPLSNSAGTSNGSPPVQYAKWVVLGTKGPISPKPPNRFLKLSSGAGPVFLPQVRGQAPNPFLQQAVKRVRKDDFYP